jgi:hypothetical protein
MTLTIEFRVACTIETHNFFRTLGKDPKPFGHDLFLIQRKEEIDNEFLFSQTNIEALL